MEPKLVLLFLVVLAATSAQKCNLTDIAEDSCSLTPLEVTAHGGTLFIDGNNCNELADKTIFANQPRVTFPQAQKDSLYSLAMLDPDAPLHDTGEYWLHWLQVNIPGDDLLGDGILNGRVVMAYKGPGPPRGTGQHRYQFYVWSQESPSSLSQETLGPNRAKFKAQDLVKKKGWCGPEAGIQFKSEY